jgi:uncharacterized protein YnzC (UPF0291/DUF896 family)
VRKLIREAVEGARDEMMGLVRSLHTDVELSREELLQRYVEQHRGQLRATLDFVARMAPAGTDVLQEAARYEAEMERQLRFTPQVNR